MKYIPKNVSITFAVPSTMIQGDYVRLFGNSGSGSVNYTTPIDSNRHDLFDGDSGLFGWGYGTWGHHPWGHLNARGVNGWGHLAWGHWGWGYGAAEIEIIKKEISPGDYVYAVQAYDRAGNVDVGTPEEEGLSVCLTPRTPRALKINNYNSTTNVLTFTIPSPVQD